MMTGNDDRAYLDRITAEIEIELENIVHIAEEFERFQRKYPEVDEFLLRALGSIVADSYNGVEKLCKLVSEECDGGIPEGESWHKRLLTNMRIQIGARPPLISNELYTKLVPLLGFRHVFRQAYGFEIDRNKLTLLIKDLSLVLQQFISEVRAFCSKIKD